MADDDQVTLVSSDGQQFLLQVKAAKLSKTIENLIEDAGVEAPIPLPNVTGKILNKVAEYCKYHIENPDIQKQEEDDKVEKRTDDICSWDQEFCQVDQPTLFELILASNYLDIPGLLDLTCKTVANMIKGKTPEQIRQTFGLQNDFTPEEEEAIRK